MERDKLFNRFLEEVYDYQRYCHTKGDILAVLLERFDVFTELTEEEMEDAIHIAQCIQDSEIYYMDFAEEAVRTVLDKRPKPESKEPPKDYLNDTLKLIGLETNQFFRINDDEFSGDDFYIDSFGDVYIACWSPDEPDIRNAYLDAISDILTLGRILTQYYDKIVPWDTKEYGYA